MKTVITAGTFDLLHYGHLNMLKRAREYGDRLIVCLTGDEYCRRRGKNDNNGKMHNFIIMVKKEYTIRELWYNNIQIHKDCFFAGLSSCKYNIEDACYCELSIYLTKL